MSETKKPRKKRLLKLLLLCLLLLVGYLMFWPVPIVEPEVWTPPVAPELTGQYAANDALAKAEVLSIAGGAGPEDVAVDGEGRIYGGLLDGRIVRLEPDGSGQETFADTGGRPLGLAWDADGNLLVCDSYKGLLRIDPAGKVEVLSTACDGLAFGFANDLDVAEDGTVYFSDASSRFGVGRYKLDLMEHRPNGRLLAWDPKTKATRLVADRLYFANGVAVVPGGDSVLVAETSTYRVLRIWTRGPKAGTREVVIENLPGFPDGISRGTEGRYWLALASPRDPVVDRTLLPAPFLRKLVVRLPEALMPQAQRVGLVVGVTLEGKVVAFLQDARPTSFSPVTSVEEHAGTLYLGSLSYPGVARIPAP